MSCEVAARTAPVVASVSRSSLSCGQPRRCRPLVSLVAIVWLVIVVALSRCSATLSADSDDSYVLQGWKLEGAQLHNIGYAPAAVQVGRYIVVMGGVLELGDDSVDLAEYIEKSTSRHVNALDYMALKMREAQLLRAEGNSVAARGGSPATTPTSLIHPVVGSGSSVRLGGDVWMLGCCNVIPPQVLVERAFSRKWGHMNKTKLHLSRQYLLSVQRIRPLQREFPSAEEVVLELGNWSLPGDMALRFNASCVAGGAARDLIYIIGGLSAETGEQLRTVAQYNITSRAFVDAVWSLEEEIVTPGVATHSQLVVVAGGFTTVEGIFQPSIEVSEAVTVLDTAHSTLSTHIGDYARHGLGWLSPHVFLRGRSMVMAGGTFDKIALWRNMSSTSAQASSRAGKYLCEVTAMPFAPLRHHAALALTTRLVRHRAPAADTVDNGGGGGGGTVVEGYALWLLGGHLPPPAGSSSGRIASDVFSATLLPVGLKEVPTHPQEIYPRGTRTGSTEDLEVIGFTYKTLLGSPQGSGATAARGTRISEPIPNQEGHVTIHVNGYTPLWYNVSFRVLLSARVADACPGVTSAPSGSGSSAVESTDPIVSESTCELMLSLSPQCDAPLAVYRRLGPRNTYMTRIDIVNAEGNATGATRAVLSVGEGMIIGSRKAGVLHVLSPQEECEENTDGQNSQQQQRQPWSLNSGPTWSPLTSTESSDTAFSSKSDSGSSGNGSDDSDEDHHHSANSTYSPQLFVYMCFSPTSSAAVADCVSGKEHSQCNSSFYHVLNANSPMVLSPVTTWTPEDSTLPPAPPPRPPPSDSYGISTLVTMVLTLFIIAVVITALAKATGRGLWGISSHDAGLLGDYDEAGGEGAGDEDAGADGRCLFPAGHTRIGRRHTRTDDHSSNDDDRDHHREAGAVSSSQAASPPLLDGKYRVIRRLGKGSFSVVYLVERVGDRQRFALKYVQCSDDAERRAALKECEVAYALQEHPGVIQVMDMFLSYRFDTHLRSERGDTGRQSRGGGDGADRYLSLVMAYEERGDLGQWVRQQKTARPKVPEATVLSIAYQVLSVLQYMHSRTPPIVHRDLKPENILLTSNLHYDNTNESFLPILVTDFGLARAMDKTFCETGVGSLPYVAPECWERRYSTKVDMWALGCILYAVCTKRVENDNVRVMFSESARPDFHARIHDELTQVYGYSERLAGFVVSLLLANAEKRPSAMEALERLCDGPLPFMRTGATQNHSNIVSGAGSSCTLNSSAASPVMTTTGPIGSGSVPSGNPRTGGEDRGGETGVHMEAGAVTTISMRDCAE